MSLAQFLHSELQRSAGLGVPPPSFLHEEPSFTLRTRRFAMTTTTSSSSQPMECDSLSSKEIALIPIQIVSKSERSTCCAICQENFKQKKFSKGLLCGHLFHIDCINKWMSRNRHCPLCRK